MPNENEIQSAIDAAYTAIKKRGKTKGTVTIEMYVHGSRETAYEEGSSQGFTDEVLRCFSHILTEFSMRFEVDPNTGFGELTHVDGRRLEKK